MTVKDLISKKDYDYIVWRITTPDDVKEEDILFGVCKSVDGKLIPLDWDTYDETAIIVHYEEWSSEEHKSGLTVVVKGEWSGGYY